MDIQELKLQIAVTIESIAAIDRQHALFADPPNGEKAT
jgi:hypothetical protein